MHRFLAAVAAAMCVLAPVLAASWSAAETPAIGIDATGVHPADLTVPVGASVVFRNDDDSRHRLRADTDGARFDTGDIEPGESTSVTFSTAGTYAYVDERSEDDPRFHGQIVVGSSSPPPGATSEPATDALVSMGDRVFSPPEVRVDVGGTVRWTNDDDRAHTATANDGSFDSASVAAGGTFAHRFVAAGTFLYRCDFHPEMTGTVVVVPADGSAPPPPAPARATPAPATTAAAPGASTASLRIEDFRFVPPSLTVTTGTTVGVTNAGRAAHTATVTGVFDTGMLRAGQSTSFFVSKPGTFPYTCLVHPEMQATLIVTGAPSPPKGQAPPSQVGAEPPPTASVAGAASVDIEDFEFTPPEIEVSRGAKVTWRNRGVAPHTVTWSGADSGLLDPGDTFTHTFEEAGTFSYKCEFHPQMTGVVRVVEAPRQPTDGLDRSTDDPLPRTASVAASSTPRTGVALAGAGVILAGTGLLLIGTKRFMSAP